MQIFIEDDAVPVIQFMEKAKYWLGEFPDDLVSFYLGMGRRPQRRTTIAHMLRDVDKSGKALFYLSTFDYPARKEATLSRVRTNRNRISC